jgi:exosortase A-associated hydrolase 2
MSSPVCFFLPGTAGNLFTMYYPPKESSSDAGNILYVHPFAGEMLASRNVIAAVSRQLVELGFGVLVVDLYGCGDSGGDFEDARWELWRDDLQVASRWLQERGGERLILWGLRLGALLAVDFAVYSQDTYERIVLWQPVLSGELMLNQFLHMNLSAEDGNASMQGRIGTREQRKHLVAGESIEVAGYRLAAELVWAIDRLNLALPATPLSAPIHWTEFVLSKQSLDGASLRVIEGWKERGVSVSADTVAGSPFWLFPHSMDSQHLAKQVRKAFAGDKNG